MTVGARMYRVEQQLSLMDRKLDQVMHALNNLAIQQQKTVPPPQHCYTTGPLALAPIYDNYIQQYQVTTATASGMTAQQLQGLQLPPGPSQANTPVSSMHLEHDV